MTAATSTIDFEKLKASDEQELRHLFELLLPMIRGQALRTGFDPADTDDIVQETLIKIFQNLHTYSGDSTRFLAWCSAIARNVGCDWVRRSTARKQAVDLCELLPDQPDLTHIQDPFCADESLVREDALRTFQDALSDLTEVERQIITFRYFEDLPLSRIAELIGFSKASTSASLGRATAKLREVLKAKRGRR